MSKKTSKKTRKKSTPRAAKAPAEPLMKKAQFVRSLPDRLTAKEVSTRADDYGLQVSEQYVYQVRMADRKKAARHEPSLAHLVPAQNGSAGPTADHQGGQGLTGAGPSAPIQAVTMISGILSNFDKTTAMTILNTVGNLAQLS